MPSTSPGSHAPTTSTPFEQILPGRPVAGHQSLATFTFRHRRYVAYISGAQLSILASPTRLLQALTFDEPLLCLKAEGKNGKLAVATAGAAWVLEPVTEGWSKIWWEKALYLRRDDPGDETRCLSWGGDGELLVGGSKHLSLFSTLPSSRSSSPAVTASEDGETVEERRSLWSKDVSSPIRWAAFSPTADLIVTCGDTDRLVKIWRRLSFEEGLFDHTYLPHPGAVTHLQWRPLEEGFEERRGSGRSGRHDDDPEVLHTIANDGVLRLWRTGSIHDLDILVLHATVDLVAAIPQSPSLSAKASVNESTTKATRYAFNIPSSHFIGGVKSAMGLRNAEAKLSHSLERLKEVVTKEPDIVVALDGHGRMSAWGLQSIGHKRRPETPSGLSKQAFHVAHCEDLPIKFGQKSNAQFEVWFDDSTLNILAHDFSGEVQWWKGETEAFFSPATSGRDRLVEQAVWSGMDEAASILRALLEDQDTLEMVYGDDSNSSLTRWSYAGREGLRCTSRLALSADIIDTTRPSSQDAAVCIEAAQGMINVRRSGGGVVAQKQLLGKGESAVRGSLHHMAGSDTTTSRQSFVALIAGGKQTMRGSAFTITPSSVFENYSEFTIEPPADVPGLMQLAAVIDSKHQGRFGIVGLTKDGQLALYHAEVLENHVVAQPSLMAIFDSGVKRASTWIASNDFAALVSEDETELTIVDLRDGYIEHWQQLVKPIQHLCAMENANVLAVASEFHVNVLIQTVYSGRRENATWQQVKQVSIAGLGLEINSLAWLGSGSLAVAAGNGAFITSRAVQAQQLQLHIRETFDLGEKSTESIDMPRLSALANSPRPVWHPEQLIYLVQQGRWTLAARVVARLLGKAKFWSEGDHLDPGLEIPADELYGALELQTHETLSVELVEELHQQLEEKKLPQVSHAEQIQLRRVLDAMLFCAEHVRGLDHCALRYLFTWKLSVLDAGFASPEANGDAPNGTPVETAAPEMHWREITFAHHSTTQHPLLDILTLAYDNKISWRTARNLGLFAWLSDREALASIFEALAQSAYRASSPPDPINATLYFLALHKKSTILGLWRIATWHKEQRATVNFLKRDFAVEANRTAARKNAYALMGKRRFEYAAAFFLLAEDAASATSVLAGQCGDVMLAIAVARLYASDGSTVLRKLVEDRLLPDAIKEGGRWQASWCHNILFEKGNAAEALVRPLEGPRGWTTDDPQTLALYRQLRNQESEWEWEAVLRGARLLRKMGLWWAAIELVSRWHFNNPKEVLRDRAALTNGAHVAPMEPAAPPSTLDEFTSPTPSAKPAEPPSMLDGFDTSTSAAVSTPSMLDGFTSTPPSAQQDDKTAREAKAAELLRQMKAKKEAASAPARGESDEKAKRQPTQFQEPSADSLLDSFGF